MPSPSVVSGSRCPSSEMTHASLNSVSVARASSSESQSACGRAPLRPMSPGYLEVFLDPVWTPLPPPVSLQALSSPDDIFAYSLPLGDCDLPYALSKKFMSQVNCVKHSVKQLRYVAHDVSLQGRCAVPLDVQGGSLSLTSSSNSLVYVWELCYLRGTWVPYPQDTCLALEDALETRDIGHDTLVQIKARDVGLHAPVNRHATSSRAVVVDVSAMCQVNVYTGMLHQVRRRRVAVDPPAGTGCCPAAPVVPYSLHSALTSRLPESIFTKPHSALRIGYEQNKQSSSTSDQTNREIAPFQQQQQCLVAPDYTAPKLQRRRKLKQTFAHQAVGSSSASSAAAAAAAAAGAEGHVALSSSSSQGMAAESSSTSSGAARRRRNRPAAAAAAGDGSKRVRV